MQQLTIPFSMAIFLMIPAVLLGLEERFGFAVPPSSLIAQTQIVNSSTINQRPLLEVAKEPAQTVTDEGDEDNDPPPQPTEPIDNPNPK